MGSNAKGLSFAEDTKRLDATCTCMAYYTSSIEVPANYTLEQAITYAREHINEIPVASSLGYIGDSDEVAEEHCKFEKEGGAE